MTFFRLTHAVVMVNNANLMHLAELQMCSYVKCDVMRCVSYIPTFPLETGVRTLEK